jgi:hypothetical protein
MSADVAKCLPFFLTVSPPFSYEPNSPESLSVNDLRKGRAAQACPQFPPSALFLRDKMEGHGEAFFGSK